MMRRWWFLVLWLLVPTVWADEVTLPFKGLTLGAELKLPEGKKVADGPVFLITHGSLAHNRMETIQSLQNELLKRGYASLAINLSLGQDHRAPVYDCTAVQNHRHGDALDEIGAWLGWLKGQGATQVVLVGHSRGGNQTAWFAAERDDALVSKVVLVAPMTWSARESVDIYRRDYGKDLRSLFAQAQTMVAQGHGDTPMRPTGFLICPEAKVTAATFVDYYRNDPRFDTPVLIKSIKKPVLVLVGTHDRFVPDLARKVEPLTQNGLVKLKLVDGADHFFHDAYAGEAADAIDAFVAEKR